MKTRKRTIVTPRRATPPKPEIFVRIAGSRWRGYARASIRVKAGQYNYLVWRDGDRIRNFYLGKRRKS
jgi:hypothetical protein